MLLCLFVGFKKQNIEKPHEKPCVKNQPSVDKLTWLEDLFKKYNIKPCSVRLDRMNYKQQEHAKLTTKTSVRKLVPFLPKRAEMAIQIIERKD